MKCKRCGHKWSAHNFLIGRGCYEGRCNCTWPSKAKVHSYAFPHSDKVKEDGLATNGHSGTACNADCGHIPGSRSDPQHIKELP